ncbi:GLUG motif-containing protein, partial [Planctomycetota bacterium]
MQDINTFLNSGWDFVDEIFNGTCDYWKISPGDYPRLRNLAGDNPVMLEGLGTALEPYLIRDAVDLGAVWYKPMAHYRLEASVDLSGIIWSVAVIPCFGGTFDGNGYVINNLHIQGCEYLGLFGRLGPEANISNLGLNAVDINGTGDYVGGLVGYNYKGGITTSFSTGTVTGEDFVGGLVGNSDLGSIASSYSATTVNGDDYVGGLVGDNSANIATSYSTGIVSGDDDVGGLVGKNWYGCIDTCFSTGTISGDNDIGGLVGFNHVGSIISSYSKGNVTGTGNVGGHVGTNWGYISSSYSTGLVTGNGENVGGLVGYNGQLSYISYGIIATSYSEGAVSGDKNVGGLVGNNSASIATSYSTGEVTGNEHIGGFVGYNENGIITTSLWDVKTSVQSTSAGGTGLTTAEMQDINTFLNTGWDFVDEIINGTCDYWKISSGDYPRLRSHSVDSPVLPEGLGTAQEPYLIRDAGDLGAVRFRPMAHYRLEASVDLSEITWSMAVIPSFGGTFDGNGHVISNIHIQGSGGLGLFGQLGSGAIVSNLGIEEIDVNGIGLYVGGLVGYTYKGTITTSFSTGTVIGDDYVGGLVGYNYFSSITSSSSKCTVSGDKNIGGLVGKNSDSNIDTSFSTGTASGDTYVGGLVGYNDYGNITTSFSTDSVTGNLRVGGLVGYNWESNITTSYSDGTISGDKYLGGLVGLHWGDCIIAASYSTSSVTGTHRVGGLVGVNWGFITTSYSAGVVRGDTQIGGLVGSGSIKGITMCFWDTQTSRRATSHGGMGKTMVEMQTASTFLETGWDFVDEIENGTEDIWWILEGQDYPRLWWESLE